MLNDREQVCHCLGTCWEQPLCVWEFLFEYLRGRQSVYIPPQVEQVRLSASQEVNFLTIQQFESLVDYEVGWALR